MNKHGKPIDKNTFGDSKAEETLAIILESRNDKSATSYVTRLLVGLTKHLKNIEFVDNKIGTRTLLYKIFRENTFKAIDKSLLAKNNPDIATYLKNAVNKRLKVFLEGK